MEKIIIILAPASYTISQMLEMKELLEKKESRVWLVRNTKDEWGILNSDYPNRSISETSLMSIYGELGYEYRSKLKINTKKLSSTCTALVCSHCGEEVRCETFVIFFVCDHCKSYFSGVELTGDEK